jgi:hypothetical protein
MKRKKPADPAVWQVIVDFSDADRLAFDLAMGYFMGVSRSLHALSADIGRVFLKLSGRS